MATYNDDLLNAAQNRRRTGRSFFPAVNSYPQGQVLNVGGANYGYGPGHGSLPPDQNPAYQAAIANNPTPASRYAASKSGTSPYTWIQTPSHGYINVPTASKDRIMSALTGSNPTPAAPPATPVNYGSQVGFSMLSNVPSPPSVSVPPTVARPYETPPAPFTTAEKFGQTLALANPLRAIPPITNALTSFGRGVFGFGRDIYGGFTGNRSTQPQPSEMGSGATPVTNPITPNLWGNSFWNRGLPARFSDAQPNDYFPQQ